MIARLDTIFPRLALLRSKITTFSANAINRGRISPSPTATGGRLLSLPQSRPMPSIGARFHELRINDKNSTWRIVYRLDSDAIVILDVFQKKTPAIPKNVIEISKARLSDYDHETG